MMWKTMAHEMCSGKGLLQPTMATLLAAWAIRSPSGH